MIEPTQTIQKPAAPQDSLLRQERGARNGAPVPAAGEVQVAEREKQVTAAAPTIDVRLDGETMRLYSELRDPETDRVLMRLPAGYHPEDDAPKNGVSTTA
ncbi:hypothetical protein [Teichococcus vastitatis]|uniref:Uncharacterized protein n=1 Tax=Teichococcus vastitatis TaxID=2307076 RepID=A0ABS9W675_9PROT|nr:hypothetical protein [Pseudoroseomonas vastitatis]MCI0754786.1 hypothetical protein [Pseudoroseomonas vastitatis]